MLLLFEFGFLTPYTPLLQYILAGLFVFAAVLFFGAFARTPAEWWRVIPGWTLLALAVVLVLSTLAVDQRWLGATVFGGLALAFTHVYVTDRAGRWWALIPGGFLLVLGLVIGFLVAWWGIPRYEAMGVVYGILAAEGAYFVVGTVAMRGHFHWRQLAPSLIKVILACALAGVVFLAGSQLWAALSAAGRVPENTWGALLEVAAVGAAGVVVFLVALVLLRTFNDDEKEAIAAMIRLR